MNEQTITVHITSTPEETIPEDERCVATIVYGKYDNMVVAGKDVATCFFELAKSIKIMDDFNLKNS